VDPTEPTKDWKISTQPDPTRPNPTHGSTQPMDNSGLKCEEELRWFLYTSVKTKHTRSQLLFRRCYIFTASDVRSLRAPSQNEPNKQTNKQQIRWWQCFTSAVILWNRPLIAVSSIAIFRTNAVTPVIIVHCQLQLITIRRQRHTVTRRHAMQYVICDCFHGAGG